MTAIACNNNTLTPRVTRIYGLLTKESSRTLATTFALPALYVVPTVFHPLLSVSESCTFEALHLIAPSFGSFLTACLSLPHTVCMFSTLFKSCAGIVYRRTQLPSPGPARAASTITLAVFRALFRAFLVAFSASFTARAMRALSRSSKLMTLAVPMTSDLVDRRVLASLLT